MRSKCKQRTSMLFSVDAEKDSNMRIATLNISISPAQAVRRDANDVEIVNTTRCLSKICWNKWEKEKESITQWKREKKIPQPRFNLIETTIRRRNGPEQKGGQGGPWWRGKCPEQRTRNWKPSSSGWGRGRGRRTGQPGTPSAAGACSSASFPLSLLPCPVPNPTATTDPCKGCWGWRRRCPLLPPWCAPVSPLFPLPHANNNNKERETNLYE